MSKYSETATTVRNQAHLVAALSELGYKAEVHADGAALVGYEGRERPERAQVIIRRVEIGPASNDIGFVRRPDGTFGAVLSEYDRGIGFDEKWLGRVHQAYKEQQTLVDAKAKGYIFRGREVVQTPAGPQVRYRHHAARLPRAGGVAHHDRVGRSGLPLCKIPRVGLRNTEHRQCQSRELCHKRVRRAR